MSTDQETPLRPAVAHYTFHFLSPSMTFIYGQVTGLDRYRPVVFANERRNAEDFPWSPVYTFSDAWWARAHRVLAPLRVSVDRVQALAFAPRFRRERVRLIHAHFAECGVRMLSLHKLLGLPMVVSFYGYDATTYPRRPGAMHDLNQLFTHVDVVTVLTRDMWGLLEGLGCPSEKLRLLPQGVDLQRFQVVRRESVADLRLLTIANFIEKKGLAYLLAAVGELRREGVDVQCRIIGDGPLRAELESRVAELGVSDVVELPGFASHDALPDHMRWANVYVQPSVTAANGDQEGLPTAIMEAMATGLPAVGSRHAGIPDLIIDGETGFLAEERDVEGLARAIGRLADAGLRDRAGEAARAHVVANYDQRKQVERLEDLYDEVLGGTPEHVIPNPGADQR